MHSSVSNVERLAFPDKTLRTEVELTPAIRLVAFAAISKNMFLAHSSCAIKTGASFG
jgi:hypothetical protein